MDVCHTAQIKQYSQRQLGWWLLLLLALFAFRVISQLLVMQASISYLPEFETWHSSTVPYPALVACQLLILIGGALCIWRMFNTQVVGKPKLGVVLYVTGWIYWSAMFIRMILGLTLLREVFWFAQTLPALFHLILANFLMLLGQFHRQITVRA